MIWIKIAIFLLLGGLNFTRGYGKIPFLRRPSSIAIMSLGLGLFLALYLKWWLFFACGIPMAIMLGFGDSNRWLWCACVALGASCALFIGHFTQLWLLIPYLLVNAFLGWLCANKLKIKQVGTDLITGAGFGLIVFLI